MNRYATTVGAALIATLLIVPAAEAATPAAGVPQEIRSGFFADVNMGGFFTLGGKSVVTGASRVSNAQAFLQLGVGYDILDMLSAGFSFSLGSSAASCFAEVDAKSGRCYGINGGDGTDVDIADNFTVSSFVGELALKLPINYRLKVQPKVHVGFSLLDPEPRVGVSNAALVGAGVGVEYATHMDHFSIGAEIFGNFMVGPNFGSFAFYPKIKYTF